jgi:hypothetical protein
MKKCLARQRNTKHPSRVCNKESCCLFRPQANPTIKNIPMKFVCYGLIVLILIAGITSVALIPVYLSGNSYGTSSTISCMLYSLPFIFFSKESVELPIFVRTV